MHVFPWRKEKRSSKLSALKVKTSSKHSYHVTIAQQEDLEDAGRSGGGGSGVYRHDVVVVG